MTWAELLPGRMRPRSELSMTRGAPLLAALGVLLALALPVALGIGAVAISPLEILAIVARQFGMTLEGVPVEARQEAVLLAIRLPRGAVGCARRRRARRVWGVGAGAVPQPAGRSGAHWHRQWRRGGCGGGHFVLVRVPPGSPSWLLAGLLPVAAFGGSALATVLVYRLAGRAAVTLVGTLLLAGIAVNAFAGAGTGLLSFVASDAQLRALVFWTLGSLGGATWQGLAGAAPCLLAALVALPAVAPSLNVLRLGESEARHLGVDVERLKRRIIFLVALGVGASVAVSGVIGFVGLVVPHLIRLAAGADHRIVLPGSILLGASLLVGADLLARTVVAPAELPIGIVTAFAGAPFFLWLLRRTPSVAWS